MSRISVKSDKFLLHYSNFFRGPLFIGTQCSNNQSVMLSQQCHLETKTITEWEVHITAQGPPSPK